MRQRLFQSGQDPDEVIAKMMLKGVAVMSAVGIMMWLAAQINTLTY